LIPELNRNYFSTQHSELDLCNVDDYVICEVGPEFLYTLPAVHTSSS